MSLEKKYLKTKPVCKVKFIAPSPLAEQCKYISLAGDFNNWCPSATPLKKQKNGRYATTLDLTPGNEYQYRFVLDDNKWENDYDADKYTMSPVSGTDNSVVVV